MKFWTLQTFITLKTNNENNEKVPWTQSSQYVRRHLVVKISIARHSELSLTAQMSMKSHPGSSEELLSERREESPNQTPGNSGRLYPRPRTSRERALSRACWTPLVCLSSIRESAEISRADLTAAAAPLRQRVLMKMRRVLWDTERWSGGSSGRIRGCSGPVLGAAGEHSLESSYCSVQMPV